MVMLQVSWLIRMWDWTWRNIGQTDRRPHLANKNNLNEWTRVFFFIIFIFMFYILKRNDILYAVKTDICKFNILWKYWITLCINWLRFNNHARWVWFVAVGMNKFLLQNCSAIFFFFFFFFSARALLIHYTYAYTYIRAKHINTQAS